MTDTWVLKALRSRTKTLSLDNSHIKNFPPSLGQLDCLTSLTAKSNELQTLPDEIARLDKVKSVMLEWSSQT